MMYPCHICANTMLPGVSYTFPYTPDPKLPSSGKIFTNLTAAWIAWGAQPKLIDCYKCKGTGLIDERRGAQRRRTAERRTKPANDWKASWKEEAVELSKCLVEAQLEMDSVSRAVLRSHNWMALDQAQHEFVKAKVAFSAHLDIAMQEIEKSK